jgi:very-short-patch-repair endonuclease
MTFQKGNQIAKGHKPWNIGMKMDKKKYPKMGHLTKHSHKKVRIGDIGHAYNCDLFVPSMNLVMECDGTYWHKYPYGREIDLIRNKEMWAKGYRVLRLWENEIKVMELDDLQNLFSKFQQLNLQENKWKSS